MIFHENHLLADNSHEISYLIFFPKIRKMLRKLSSAAVVIGAVRVKEQHFMTDLVEGKYFLLIFKIYKIHVNFIHNKVAAIMSCSLKSIVVNATIAQVINMRYVRKVPE